MQDGKSESGEPRASNLQPIHLMKRYLIEILIIVIISASYGFAAYQRNFVWKDDLSIKKQANSIRHGALRKGS